MITDFKKVIDKVVELSENGYLAVSYGNSLVSLEFKFTERLELDIQDDGTYRLWYVDESHACPSELRIKESDVLKVTYYEAGEFENLISQPVIEIFFKDGGIITCFEDVR